MYTLLVAATGEHKESVALEKVTRKLRDALLSGEVRGQAEMERRQKVHRLLRELRGRKRLQRSRDEKGSPLLESGSIARALKDFWGKIMGVQGEPPEAQLRFFESLGLPDKIRRAIALLMRPLSEDIVLAALERMPKGLLPGLDGVTTYVYKFFPSIFVPRLLASKRELLEAGAVLDAWSI